jgi:hypothetical protein
MEGLATLKAASTPKPDATADEVLALMFEQTGLFKMPFLAYVEAAGMKPPIPGPLSQDRLNSLRRILEIHACE